MTLREFLEREYTSDPAVLGRIAQDSYYLVKTRRSYWRGQRVIKNSKITVGDKEIQEGLTSEPRWNLLPDKLKSEFSAINQNIDRVLEQYCIGGIDDEDTGELNSLIGNGVYVVDKMCWPRLSQLLTAASNNWAESADSYCTEDGYEQLLGDIKEKLGEDIFEDVKELVPKREVLRRKFKFLFEVLPVRMTQDPQQQEDSHAASGRMSLVIDTLESAIKYPRVKLSEGITHFLKTIAEEVDGCIIPKKTRLGNIRGIRADTIKSLENSISDWKNHTRYSDVELITKVDQLSGLLPAFNTLMTYEQVSHNFSSGLEFANLLISRCLDVNNISLNEQSMIASVIKMRE